MLTHRQERNLKSDKKIITFGVIWKIMNKILCFVCKNTLAVRIHTRANSKPGTHKGHPYACFCKYSSVAFKRKVERLRPFALRNLSTRCKTLAGKITLNRFNS